LILRAYRTNLVLAFLAGILAVTTACDRDKSTVFSIHFEHIRGLAEGDMVLYQGKAVGRIVGVKQATPSGFVTDVKVFSEFKDLLREGSTFTITLPHPGLAARPRIDMKLTDSLSRPIRSGFTTKGSEADTTNR